MVAWSAKHGWILLVLCVFSHGVRAFDEAEKDVEAWPLWDGKESLIEYAKRCGVEPELKVDLAAGVQMEMVLVPAASFVMGKGEPVPPNFWPRLSLVGIVLTSGLILVLLAAAVVRRFREKSALHFSLRYCLVLFLLLSATVGGIVYYHKAIIAQGDYERQLEQFDPRSCPSFHITISRPFYIGKYEVTQKQYSVICRPRPHYLVKSELPADTLALREALSFCSKASGMTGRTVRLPWEDEWEYACVAKTAMASLGDMTGGLKDWAWFLENSGGRVHPVGKKKPNAFGIHDMLGNLGEWCGNRYFEYPKVLRLPPDLNCDDLGVVRGGDFQTPAELCRPTTRKGTECDNNSFGFRCVVEIAPRVPTGCARPN